MRPGIGHGQDARLVVLQSKVLVLELRPVDGFPACALNQRKEFSFLTRSMWPGIIRWVFSYIATGEISALQ